VVSLVTFLIGVVFAYLLGLQAERYGANIFVVDGVAIGMAREFAPMLVAVIVAGRSGAAFTAQLGTMKLTEETDAIRVLGPLAHGRADPAARVGADGRAAAARVRRKRDEQSGSDGHGRGHARSPVRHLSRTAPGGARRATSLLRALQRRRCSHCS